MSTAVASKASGSAPVRQPQWPRRRQDASPQEAARPPLRQALLKAAQHQPRSTRPPRPPQRAERTTEPVVAPRERGRLRATGAGGRARSRQCLAGRRQGGARRRGCKSLTVAFARVQTTGSSASLLRARACPRPCLAHLRTARQARHRRTQAPRRTCSSCESIAGEQPAAPSPERPLTLAPRAAQKAQEEHPAQHG